MHILFCGGAGYIGSHMVKLLAKRRGLWGQTCKIAS
jgi:UDP-glucose 4-epimerase